MSTKINFLTDFKKALITFLVINKTIKKIQLFGKLTTSENDKTEKHGIKNPPFHTPVPGTDGIPDTFGLRKLDSAQPWSV